MPTATILGNVVGVDATVSVPLPNGGASHFAPATQPIQIGGSGPGEGNIVSGNANLGICAATGEPSSPSRATSSGPTPRDAQSRKPRGGHSSRRAVTTGGRLVGGIGPGEANVVAYNGGRPGWYPRRRRSGAFRSNRVTVRGNRIFGNVSRGFAPDFVAPAPNDPLDADTGANNLQNSPMITGVDYGPPTVVHATLERAPSTAFDIDFYANPVCVTRPTAFPQGQDYVGSTQVTTDASGTATVDFSSPRRSRSARESRPWPPIPMGTPRSIRCRFF